MNFDYLLKDAGTFGIVFVDRFNDEGNLIDAHLRRKFAVGLEGEGLLTNPLPLRRVVGLHYTTIGQSHLTSLIDIILGTYRTAFNIYSRQEEQSYALAKDIFEFIAPLFQRAEGNCIPRVAISFSPLEVRAPVYRRKYRHVIERMNSCGYNLTQMYQEIEV